MAAGALFSLSSLPPQKKKKRAPPRAGLSFPSAASRQRFFEDQASPELLQVLEWSFWTRATGKKKARVTTIEKSWSV